MVDSKLRILVRNQLDDQRWNNLIDASKDPLVFAQTWYLDLVCPHWKALVYGNYEAIMPLPIFKKGYLLPYLTQPLFCPFLRIFTDKNTRFQTSNAFFEAILNRFSYVSSLYFTSENIEKRSDLEELKNFLIPLDKSYKNLYETFTEDRRMNFRRAYKEPFRIEESNDTRALIELFKENHAKKISATIPEKTYQLLDKVIEKCLEKGVGKLLYAVSEESNRVEAGAFFTIYGRRISYLFNAASPFGRKHNARLLLLENMMQDYAETSYLLDLKYPATEGIKQFYEGFNPIYEPLFHWEKAGWLGKFRQ